MGGDGDEGMQGKGPGLVRQLICVLKFLLIKTKTRPVGGCSRTLNIKGPSDLRFAHGRRCKSKKAPLPGYSRD